jgi:hypothetical protein
MNAPQKTYQLATADSAVFSLINIDSGNKFVTAERNGCITEWIVVKNGHQNEEYTLVKVRVIEKHIGASFCVDYFKGNLVSVGADGTLCKKI